MPENRRDFFGSTTRCITAIDAANFLLSDWLYSLIMAWDKLTYIWLLHNIT